MFRTSSVLTALTVVAMAISSEPAYAIDCANNMPSPWDTASCTYATNDVCAYDGDLGEIVCNGSGEADEIVVISLGGDPIAFGYVAGSNPFCCDATQMDDDTHNVWISTGDGDDIICLHDSSNGDCSDNLGGNQYWSYPSEIYGGDGDDFISTSKSSSLIVDLVYGGADADTIYTHAGDDEIYGGSGNDEIYGGPENDLIFGEAGIDTISGEAGKDVVDGGTEDDIIYGGDGDDELCGGGGADAVYGMNHDDCLCGGGPLTNVDLADDVPLRGDSGTDTCYWWGSDAVNCDTPSESATCLCGC